VIGKTLSIYIAVRFLKTLLAMVFGLAFLIVTVDFIEQLRKAADSSDVGLGTLYLISLLRAPAFIEQAFPFACLFAAMLTLTQLNSKMELVVARASGVSALEFMLPISLSALVVGVGVATLYNPLAIRAFEKSGELSAEVLKTEKRKARQATRNVWLRQVERDGGFTIINAERARQRGVVLDNTMMVRFDTRGDIYERVDARQLEFDGEGSWQVKDARITPAQGSARTIESYLLPTTLTSSDLLGITGKPETVSFWQLREVAEKVERAGTNAKPYLVRFHSLVATPVFLLAMVILAGTVCLRFVRFGQVGRMVLGGISCGFVLYAVTSLITALGSNGIVPPPVAAWTPGIVAILFGMSVLLHQEDG